MFEYARIPSRQTLRRLLCSAAMLFGIGCAHAAPTFTTNLDLPGTALDDSDQSAVSSVLVDSGEFVNGVLAAAAAHAAPTTLGARAEASTPGGELPLGIFVSGGAGASARARFDDVVITNLDNPGNLSPIQVSTNFRLDGFFSLTNESTDTRSNAAVSVTYGLGTGLANAVTTIGGIGRTIDRDTLTANNSGVFQNSGLGNEMSIHGVFSSTVLTVPVGVPIPLSLGVVTGATAVSRDGGAVAASSNFLDTLFLAASGPVFNLPAGYTVNSISAHILDNQLQSVPLPPVVLLLSSALAIMLRCNRSSRSHLIG